MTNVSHLHRHRSSNNPIRQEIKWIDFKRTWLTSCVIGAVSLSGCASLKVKTIDNPTTGQTGLKYELPLTQFQIDISRRVVACRDIQVPRQDANGNDILDPTGQKIMETKQQLIFSTEAVVKPRVVSDTSQAYVIDHRSLSTWFNRAAFSVEYHTGTRNLKSINASVEDLSGPALITAFKTAAGLGSLPGATGGEQVLECKAEIKGKVKLASDQLEIVKRKTDELKSKTREVARLKVAVVKNASPNALNDLTEAIDEEAALSAELSAETKLYAELSKPVTIKHKTIFWPTTGNQFTYDKADDLIPTVAQLAQVATNIPEVLEQDPEDDNKPPIPTGALKPTIQDRFRVEIKIENESNTPFARPIVSGVTAGVKRPNKAGIYYREPETGRLKIVSTEPKKTIHSKSYPISQLGFVDVLPISTQWFESAEFSAEFDTFGRLTKVGYKQTATPSAMVGSLVETAAGVNRAKADQDNADLAREITRLEAEQKLEELKSTPDEDVVQTLEEQVVINAATLAINEATTP